MKELDKEAQVVLDSLNLTEEQLKSIQLIITNAWQNGYLEAKREKNLLLYKI